MKDFAVFVEGAHAIGLGVVQYIILLVTCDQHYWVVPWLLAPYCEYHNYCVLMNDSSVMVSHVYNYTQNVVYIP
ncbi:hypothetical protein HPB48_013781 [Haemaphysalis longicornis]|uniref:Uncharacterized protein n=1 Tax=Haemaphysalis longicornis TaxID=44386 RepID=A0A9J6GCH1_HAELO|nr:hypothetical protein HPB48_013781 [Haemaphysalis longicornis]